MIWAGTHIATRAILWIPYLFYSNAKNMACRSGDCQFEVASMNNVAMENIADQGATRHVKLQ